MAKNWFAGCETTADIKSLYRKLAMQYHPDRGGDDATMAEINIQYERTLCGRHGATETGADGSEHTYYYNAEHERAVMDKLAELLRMQLPGCEIWLIGKWLWVKGETKPVKDLLKAAGLRWHGERLAWYYKPYEYRTRYNEKVDFDGLADYYGARMFTTSAAPMAAAA